MTWSPSFNLSSSYKDAEYWNNPAARTDAVDTVTTASEGFWYFTLVTPIMIDTCPCMLSSGSTEVFMWTEITKHTGNHEMEQHSGSAPLPILGSPSTPLWDKTNKLTKAKQKNLLQIKPFLGKFLNSFQDQNFKLWKKWRYNNRKRNPRKKQISLTSSKKS